MDAEKIHDFLYGDGSGYGDGYGYGSGYGAGDGYGDGAGSGYGDGAGSGYGYGAGDGYGYGDGYGAGDGYGSGAGSGYCSGAGSGYCYSSIWGKGLGAINGHKIHMIDDLQTIIYHVHGNIARGAIVMEDLSLRPCYICKQGGKFAHGDTLREAMEALREKLYEDMPEEERIQAFVDAHKAGQRYPNTDYFDWHHRLTGSCKAGREAFVRNHGLDMAGSMTPEEFIRLTEHDYGGEIIRQLRDYYPTEE